MQEILSHSRLACFRACPRRHLYRYDYGLRPLAESLPLRVGSAFALAVEAGAKGDDVTTALGGRLEDPYEMAVVAAMYLGHAAYWANEPAEHVAAELEFDLPLVNPATGKPTPRWRIGGKIDRIVRLHNGRLALKEYKTTTRDITKGSSYWLRLSLDAQLSLYLIAAREMGYDIETIEYDVTRRPTLRPHKATPEESRKYKANGELYANQRDTDETPNEFATRVAAAIAEAPEKYFVRGEIARTDADIDEFRKELWIQQLAIRQAQRADAWFRNPEACISATGQACDYLPICTYTDLATKTPEGFRRAAWAHEELTRTAATQE